MTYFLYRLRDRLMIDNEPRNWDIEGSCTANSWLHAKKLFGFDLTPMQLEILKARER